MPYTVVATPEFERDYKKLSHEVAARVTDRIDDLASNPDQMRFPLKHLPESLKGLHKFRIGDYRLLFWPDHNQERIVLYAIAHRREIYRRLG